MVALDSGDWHFLIVSFCHRDVEALFDDEIRVLWEREDVGRYVAQVKCAKARLRWFVSGEMVKRFAVVKTPDDGLWIESM